MSNTSYKIDGSVLVMERVMHIPRQKLWDTWTTPELFAQWWGPNGWETTVEQMDFKVGGSLLYCITCNDPKQKEWYGQKSWGKYSYSAIEPIKGFTYSEALCDSKGVVSTDTPEVQIAMKFYEVDSGTKMVSIADFGSETALKEVIDMGIEQSINQAWNRLEDLASHTKIK